MNHCHIYISNCHLASQHPKTGGDVIDAASTTSNFEEVKDAIKDIADTHQLVNMHTNHFLPDD